MSKATLLVLLLAGTAVGQVAPKDLPRDQWPLQERINDAIERGIEWLRTQPSPEGLFQSEFGAAGTTALILYTLAASGVPDSDPVVAKAAAALSRLPVDRGTVQALSSASPALRMAYTHSLSILALATLDPEKYRSAIHRSVQTLIRAQEKSGQWAYILSMGGPLDQGDNSNTQFALLALRLAALKGFRVPSSVWKRSLTHFQRSFGEDGGWGYGCRGTMEGTYGSMTAVAVASMVISRAMLLGGDKAAEHDYLSEREIARGMIWLEDNFAVDRHPGIDRVQVGMAGGGPPGGGGPGGRPPGGGGPGAMPGIPGGAFHYYWLYSVERVGMLLGRRHIGNHDWYREGAEWLVGNQAQDGSWVNPAGAMMAPEPRFAATCFALLFLKRATIPVVTPPPEKLAPEKGR